MSTKIPIHVSNKKAYIWDVESAEIVRTKHHITGLLTGTLPSLAQQNVFLGLPLSLMAEEAVYLVEKGVAVLLDNASANTIPPSSAELAEWRKGVVDYRTASQDHLAKLRKEKEVSKGKQDTEEAQRKRMAREARKKSAPASDPLHSTAEGNSEVPLTTTTAAEELFVPNEEETTPHQAKAKDDKKAEDTSYTVLIPSTTEDHPWFQPPVYETIDAAKEAGVWTYPSTPIERAKCAVYKDLIDQGYFLGGGLKFGGDWLVYPGDQLRYHSHFVATVFLTSITKLTPMQIVAYGRLGTVTKKAHLLCGWDEETGKVDYYSIEWAYFGAFPASNPYGLTTLTPFLLDDKRLMEVRMALPHHQYHAPPAMGLRRKRSRSPGSPTPFERAPKRHSLGPDVLGSAYDGAEGLMVDASMEPPEIIVENDVDMAIEEDSTSKSLISLNELPIQQPSFTAHSTIKQSTSPQLTPSIPRSGSDPFLAATFRQTQKVQSFGLIFLPYEKHSRKCLMSRSVCKECGGALEYVPDALSFVCVSCGIMSNPNQYFLVGDVDDANATGYEKEGMSVVFHPYAQSRTNDEAPEEASLLKEQRYRRNMAKSHEFIRSVLNHMGIRSYYDRVVALFDASMAKGKFRFGSCATSIIGACILITMRESGIPETLKSLAARLDLTPARLTGSTYKILSLHGMRLKPTDPLNYIPAVLRTISEILNSPIVPLPAPLRTFLSTPSLNAVQNLATDLCYLTEIVNLTHNRLAPPVACALTIVALEGEIGKCAPALPRLAELLSAAFNVSRETTLDRYLEVQELLGRWKTNLPWFTVDVHPTVEKKAKNVKKRKAAQPEREEHAGLVKDIVIFQEELWRKSKEMENATAGEASLSNGGPSQLSAVGRKIDLTVEFEGGSDEDAGSDDGATWEGRGARGEESLELAGSTSSSTPGSTTDTVIIGLRNTAASGSSTRGLSPFDSGQDSEGRPAKRQRRVPDDASTKPRTNSTATTSTTAAKSATCLRPAYAQRKRTKRETWDANLAKATAALLGGGRGSTASSGKSKSGGPGFVEVDGDSVDDFIRKHVLAVGVREASERMGARGISLGRLERLALVVGEANIGDEALFDDGEMEGYLREEAEIQVLKKIWEAEHGVEEGGYEDEGGEQVERDGNAVGSLFAENGTRRARKAVIPSKPKRAKKEKQVKVMDFGALELALSSLGGRGGREEHDSGSGASSVTGDSSTIERWELDLLERLVGEDDKDMDDGYEVDDDGFGDERDQAASGYHDAGVSYDPYEDFEEL
ncbi:tRNA-splicing endonuclease subunit [Tulasnella sp. 427]|nr:tRNA-splicing endonuclease subunit [Tulasnella sp. 427]